jgi:thiol-disulfide isomerase/thioredoxin
MQTRVRSILCLLAVLVFSAPSFGSPQAIQKPLVLVVYADWCPLCQKLKPALALINEKYKGRIRFVRLDVTTEATTERSRREARSLGLERFFDKYHETTSLVVIQDPAGHEIFRAFHDYDFQHYATVLDQQLGPAQE